MKLRVLLLQYYSPISSSSSHSPLFFFSPIVNTSINYTKKFSFLHFSSIASTSVSSSSSISKNPNPIFIDFLIQTLGFSKTQADSISKKIESRTRKIPQKPDSFVHFLRQFGFSDTHIQRTVLSSPQILSSNVETLKPKLSLFQKELGLTGSDLGLFISNNPNILTVSLERRLIPNINILKKIIQNRERGKFVPRRCDRFLAVDPRKLLSSVSFLQSCGIPGDQLSSLLKRHSSLFIKPESVLRGVLLKAQEMGFSCNSRMFAHAVSILGPSNSETLESKFKLLRSFGFSQEECSAMFRTAPLLLQNSEEKIKLGIEFFDNAGLERKFLVHNPVCLMFSLEKRVIPRFRVYQILKSKQLLNKKFPSFPYFLKMSEKSFLDKFVFNFGDNAEELLAAYNNGNVLLNSSPERN